MGSATRSNSRTTAGWAGAAIVLLAAALLVFLALSIRQTVSSVQSTLPCEVALINEGVSIDPMGYSLYSDELVAQSKALDRCMEESRQLIHNGQMEISELARPFVTLVAGGLITMLLVAGWLTFLFGSRAVRSTVVLALISMAAVASVVVQLRHGEVLEAVGWITN